MFIISFYFNSEIIKPIGYRRHFQYAYWVFKFFRKTKIKAILLFSLEISMNTAQSTFTWLRQKSCSIPVVLA
jgi:hypothetical protein